MLLLMQTPKFACWNFCLRSLKHWQKTYSLTDLNQFVCLRHNSNPMKQMTHRLRLELSLSLREKPKRKKSKHHTNEKLLAIIHKILVGSLLPNCHIKQLSCKTIFQKFFCPNYFFVLFLLFNSSPIKDLCCTITKWNNIKWFHNWKTMFRIALQTANISKLYMLRVHFEAICIWTSYKKYLHEFSFSWKLKIFRSFPLESIRTEADIRMKEKMNETKEKKKQKKDDFLSIHERW